MWLLLIAGLGLIVMATSSGGAGAETEGAAQREVLLEPPDRSHITADYIIELDTKDNVGGPWAWRVFAQRQVPGHVPARELLDSGTAPTREQAVDEAYDVIEKQRGKLPSPVNRYGLRVGADCSSVTVQNLEEWLAWAEPAVDVAAEALHREGRLSGAQLMRLVWSRAFPECAEATPRMRLASWNQTARRVDAIVKKQLDGEFIDVHPVGRVLAAKIVGMSPPKVPGRAFFHPAPGGVPYAVIVDKAEDGWRWRAWPRQVDGAPQHGGLDASEQKAANAAKNWIDSLQEAHAVYQKD